MQLGHLTQGRVVRGNAGYGFVLNVSATEGFRPEARVSIAYRTTATKLTDGSTVELREPRYQIDNLDGPGLAPDTVLMPRLPPLAMGDGMLELVPAAELERVARDQASKPDGVRGQLAWLSNTSGNVPSAAATRLLGRFGWQASEPTVASQVAVAFAREMGLTNPLESHDDCAPSNAPCKTEPSGGTPEVAADLFDAVVNFERWHAVPVPKNPDLISGGAQLFESTGCTECHRPTLNIDANRAIHPFTDLLLHDMGQGLADRTTADMVVPSRWRTAPLWGMHAAAVATQAQHYLHDGRARSLEEAVLWHDGEGRHARDRFVELNAEQRHALIDWINTL
jgi:CxxC motif-containing protein (DUF1111 family)